MARCAIVLLVLCFVAPPARAQSAPPKAAVRPVEEVHYGTKVVDPYRWLEDLESPEVRDYIQAQHAHTRSVLDRVPEREELARRIGELDESAASVFGVRLAAGNLFYMKTEPGGDVPRLCVRRSPRGAERVLFDPTREKVEGSHLAIDFFDPSPDGRYVAFGVSAGGRAETELRVLEVATGRALPERIDRIEFFYYAVTWQRDGRSFYYSRADRFAPDAPQLERHLRIRVFRHVIGTPVERDLAVFGYGLTKAVEMTDYALPFVLTHPRSRYAVGVVTNGAQPEFELYVADLASIERGRPEWRRVASVADNVRDLAQNGDDLYLLTNRGAARGKVVRVPLARPALSSAKIVLAEGPTIVQGLSAASDALYVRELDAGVGRMRRVPFAGGGASYVELPFVGSIDEVVVAPDAPGAILKLASWTESPRYFAVDVKTGTTADTGLLERSRVDFSGIEAIETEAVSADGTRVPLSIVARKGLERDGSNPTIVAGYGAYGISITPYFTPRLMAWLERGGVYAVAHIRGGGERGEEWHRAAMKLTKGKTTDDFIACAEKLIADGWTSPARLAAEGWSAGGITVGTAINRRPDLFAAVIVHAGAFNTVRGELTDFGPANIPEFGSVASEEGFRGLLAMDSYLAVRDGAKYPAVFLDTGLNDSSVPAWFSAKMAARLQAATASGRPVLLRVESDAGHGFTRASQRNALLADRYAFLLWQLGASRVGAPSSAAASSSRE